MERKLYEEWLSNSYFEENTKQELLAISNDDKEIKERFYKELEFGTAGLRGIIGAGTNRINIYTVRKATQGLANYIIKQKGINMGVAIAYDSRIMSKEFACEAALCLCANGIKAYIFDGLRSTPELSFAVRTLNCMAGINITASHNPPEYNGYKVYWKDGAQVTPPHDIGIMDEVKSINDYADVKTMNIQDALDKGLYNCIGEEIDSKYIGELKKQVLNPDCITKMQQDIRIVYTPLHGTGNIPVRRVLKELGFENVFVVSEQELPDGKFPTVSYPNPESEQAYELALKLAKEKDADIILATDPDADRLGAYVKDSLTGEYVFLTGNMSGCLLAEYKISQLKEKDLLPKDGTLIKTIVTTKMAESICDYFGVTLCEVLTGFKYIGEKILEFETTGNGTYLFGFEESYGCLIGTYARDKDAVAASMLLCEALAYYKSKKLSLWDELINMYEKYGYYKDDIISITLKGIEGLEKIKVIMEELQNNPPSSIGNYKVKFVRDYTKQLVIDKETNQASAIKLPKTNAIFLDLEDDAWVCVRPSGTEPKIKLYYGIKGNSLKDANKRIKELGDYATKLLQ